MKRRKCFHPTARVLSWMLCLTMLLSLLPAAYATPADGAAQSSNKNRQDYSTWASTVKSYLYENESGGLTRVEYINGTIVVEDYSSSFALQSSRTIPMELSIWGGFFAGADYNFLVFGQENRSESDNAEVIRVVKYDKNWNRMGQASLNGANTVIPFDAGSLRCAEYGGWLYIRTCHEMYTSSDGLNHQANVMMAVRQSDMTITDSYYDVMNSNYGYVSHSFNQFVIVDQDGYIVTLDHGDAYPRGVVFMRYYQKAGQAKFRGDRYGAWCSSGNMIDFAGSIGDNNTGGSIGGLAETGSCYVMTYNYDNAGGRGDRYPFFHFMDKASGRSWSVQLTQTPGASTPVLASTGLDGGYVMWNGKSGYTVDDTLYYLSYTASGQPGETQTATAPLSDCQPIYYNGKVVWYVTDNSAPTFYQLDNSGVTATPAGGSPIQSGQPTQPVQPGDSAGAFPDVPASHWASPEIQQCLNLGIVAGFENGTFGPDKAVTGAQFATMLNRMFFKDAFDIASKDSRLTSLGWYVPALHTADKTGVLTGTSQLSNGSGDSWSSSYNLDLTRYDMAQMLYNVINAKGKTPGSAALAQAQAAVSDFNLVPANYKTAVSACIASGIIQGMNDGTFSGGQSMNRAQACVVMIRMQDLMNGGGNPAPQPETPVTLTMNPKSLTLTAGESDTVRATVSGASPAPSVTYTSSDRSVATVSGGTVTAKAAGTAVITASITWQGRQYTDQCTVTVKAAAKPVTLTMSPKSLTLTAGESDTVRATVSGASPAPSVTYTSSDRSVATVSGGTVTAKAAGTAVITASITWQGRQYTDQCTVTVKAAPASTVSPKELSAEVVRLVNEERAKAGLPALQTFATLTAAAGIRAPELNTLFEHTRPDGSDCFTALDEAGVSGYYTAGENIAYGSSTAEGVMDQWMNSSGHRANILNPDFTHIGVACVESSYGYAWVQMFVGSYAGGGHPNPDGSGSETDTNPGGSGSETDTNPGGSGSEIDTNPGGSGSAPDTGDGLSDGSRTSHYRHEWRGNYLDVQIVNGNTIQFSGCVDVQGPYNYAVLRAFGNSLGYTPFTSGVPFTVSTEVDVAGLSELYGGDTSQATSYVTAMICQNYTPGDSSLGGMSFQNGVSLSLALDGHGGLELQVNKR